MKKLFVCILVLSMITLAACQSSQLPTTTGRTAVMPTATKEPTDPKPTEPKPTEPKPTDPKPTDPKPTEPANEELAKWNALFGNLDSWYNKALTCEYATPAQLDMEAFFLAAFREDDNAVTASERAQLKELFTHNPDYQEVIDRLDITRLPVERMNKVLQEYFGITLEDIDEAGFKDLHYLESTNSYYIIGGGASVTMGFRALSVQTMEDGSICVSYTANWEDTVYVVTLMPQGDGYQILSNVPAA